MTQRVYEGPVTVKPQQLSEVVALANRVFRSGKPGNMGSEFPLLFHPDRLDQLRVMLCEGKPVALVGNVIDQTVMLGCPLRVASMGSVCTDSEHRGQNLAGRLVDDAVARSIFAGAPLMRISGGRSLYARRGGVACGRFPTYTAGRDQLPPPADLAIEEVTDVNSDEALRLFEAEPMRHRRQPADYRTQNAAGHFCDHRGTSYLVRSGRRAVAVLSATRRKASAEDPTPLLEVVELAGTRHAAVSALALVMARQDVHLVRVAAYESDLELAECLGRCKAAVTLQAFHGTVKLLDPQRLWREFMPLLIERIGPQTAAISLDAQADELSIHTLTFRSGSQSLTLKDQDIMFALFGSTQRDVLAGMDGPLAGMLRRALPLPLLNYQLNYV